MKVKNIVIYLFAMIIWIPFSVLSYIGMLPILWGFGKLIEAVELTWWQFTKCWFLGEWLEEIR